MSDVSLIPPDQVVVQVASALRIPDRTNAVTPHLLAQALRRAAHILAPCSRPELERAVRQSFRGLGLGDDEVRERIEETLEALLIYSEILEMRAAVDDPWDTSPFVLRPAPPSFVVAQNQSLIVLGVAGDELTPFSEEFNGRLVFEGVLRILPPVGDEDLRSLLRDLGLIELTEQAWLRLPSVESAAAHIAGWRQQLAAAPQSAAIEGLRILDTARPVFFYPERWVQPAPAHSGMYVARRAQLYGADLWCLVELERGVPARFLDLVSKGDRLRPCDVAWRIQMALDASAGGPQRFRIRQEKASPVLDFFSPLPSWAERKLAVVGQRAERHKCMLSYAVPASDTDNEIRFLRERLWIAPEE
jgi:hypothetical protein